MKTQEVVVIIGVGTLVYVLWNAVKRGGIFAFEAAPQANTLTQTQPSLSTQAAQNVLEEIFRPLKDWMEKYSTPEPERPTPSTVAPVAESRSDTIGDLLRNWLRGWGS